MNTTHREFFLQHQAQTSEFPIALEFKRAEGCYLYDTQGKAYLDLISGISVSNLGHGNKHVANAIINQVNSHMHLMVYGEFIQAPQARLARKLTSLLPETLNCVYFVNSGAEATDGALKLAKRVTGRSKIVACRKAYHGSTHAALSLNSEEVYKNRFRPLLPDIHFIDFNNTQQLDCIDEKTACFIVEVVASEQGYIPANPDFLEAARKRCSEHCALLIFDEIQTGFGRTGKLFAFEHDHVVPDILLLGKALGAGMPMGAFISSQHMMNTLAKEPVLGHITTFGGHPVCCSAALAGIEELEQNRYMEEVAAKAELFKQNLTHPAIRQVNGKGLMMSLQFDSFEQNKSIIDLCMKDGLIVDWFLFAPDRLRITPPLCITPDEIEKACSVLSRNINLVSGN
ncbi:MAG: aspartate aminotransferase family protein [Bacteroidota bacterium]|jgi:acetylornithine/N-succinyldiaminopimelate aminotransferase